MSGQQESPATATRTEEKKISTNQSSSSSSSKKRTIITNSSSHSSRKKTRRSSRLKRQLPDQNCTDDKSDSEVEDENELEDYEPDVAVINQSSSSQISTKRQRQNELKWKNKFEKLRAFKQLHGHANVPRNNKELGLWVDNQRAQYRKLKKNGKASITPERIQTLESIGFEWVPNIGGSSRKESAWNKRFNELKVYKEKYRRTNVPKSENKELGNWVKTQRVQYKKFQENGKASINPERIQRLESIGFQWELNPEWNKRFNELKAYKEKYGHTNVPNKWKDNKQLGNWVSTQRYQYKKFQENKKTFLTPERIQTLESIGFEWVAQNDESLWNKRFNELKAYKEKYGRTNVTKSENKQLGNWVSTQRAEYRKLKDNKKSAMTPERIRTLESIGFEWVAERINMLNSIGFQWECRPNCAPRS